MKESKLFGNRAEPMIVQLNGHLVKITICKSERPKVLKFKGKRKARHFYDSLQLI